VSDHVTFFTSPPDERRNQILRECFALLYTPSNEHFGIVPLEAALASKPVVACNSGGPLETIVDGVTGFLREPEPSAWAAVLCSMIRDQNGAMQLGRAARARVLDRFSVATFQATLERVMRDMLRAQD
jgi:alpha-1,3/alpha-1,6-mannosyltransferase